MSPEVAQALAMELTQAPHGAKEAILARWSETTGKSRSTLWRWAKRAGYQPQQRKERSDKGVSRAGITPEAEEYLVALMAGSRRKTGRVTMPTTRATKLLVKAGLLPEGARPETVRRRLREQGLSRRDIAINWTCEGQKASAHHINLISERPNQLHQFDITPCIWWYLNSKGLVTRDRDLELYGRKASAYRKIKDHILRFVLVDHHTNCIYVRYFLAAGERSSDVWDFLYHAWAPKDDPLDPFHGVPERLYFDRGSANMAATTTRLLDNLRVEWGAHQPGVPRAKGAVEGMMRIWEEQFESMLFLRRPSTLEQLNRWADDFRVHWCATEINRRTQATRSGLWASRIRSEDLRVPPPREVYNELITERPHRTRVNRSKRIQYKGEHYLLEASLNVGAPIEIVRNPYRLPEIDVYVLDAEGARAGLAPCRHLPDPQAEGVPVGTYRRYADTPVQRVVKRASGLDLEQVAKAAFGKWRDDIPDIAYLPTEGREVEIGAQVEERPMTLVQAVRQVRREMGWDRLTTLQNQLLKQRLGPAPTPSRVAALVRELRAKGGEEPDILGAVNL